jgi:thiamine-monophosphate kinase
MSASIDFPRPVSGAVLADPVEPTVLGDLGERRIFADILAPSYKDVTAFGDDCAVLGGGVVVTTDSCPTPMVDQLGDADPYAAGWLLATINLSDLAAAGAEPSGLVVNYTLPTETPVGELRQIIKGVNECATSHDTEVVGGDIRDGKARHLSATAIGRTPRHLNRYGRMTDDRLSRRGAKASDVLLLIGNPGNLWGAALVHRGHADVPAHVAEPVFELARKPVAQLKAGQLLAQRRLATAAMDVSDGLFASVKILAETNGVGAVMEPDIRLSDPLMTICEAAGVSPFQLAQNWGDWCLLVAVKAKNVPSVGYLLGNHGIGVHRVGSLTSDPSRILVGGPDGPQPWAGIDQERFTASSWQGDGIDAHIAWMQDRSRRP